MTINHAIIGGYNELSLPFFKSSMHHSATKLQSARAALYLFLKISNAKRIYLPEYICESILPPLRKLNIEIRTYAVDNALNCNIPDTLEKHDFLLLVNYFGLNYDKIKKYTLTPSIKPDRVILDNSQALFSPTLNCGATIYSPRKYFGIPDGGYLYSNIPIDEPRDAYDGEQWLSHLSLRSSGNASEGYKHYLLSEKSLEDFEPKKMSSISKRLISSIDVERVYECRIENFNSLHRQYSEINDFPISLKNSDSPLCYPLRINRDVSEICVKLKKKNIFIPRYWPTSNHSKNNIYKTTIFLPIDERIGKKELETLINAVNLEIKA